MRTFVAKGKAYSVDNRGFLLDPGQWDEQFAQAMAGEAGIRGGLTEDHWRYIRFIRSASEQIDKCPLIYVACKNNDLGLGDVRQLFPAGWLRGACKLAGLTYRKSYLQYTWLEGSLAHITNTYNKKTYEVDEEGFLRNPSDWDENFAVRNASALGIPGNLNHRHWPFIHFLRDYYQKTGSVPTMYDTGASQKIDFTECERLFPGGYYRGALKVAGLRPPGD